MKQAEQGCTDPLVKVAGSLSQTPTRSISSVDRRSRCLRRSSFVTTC